MHKLLSIVIPIDDKPTDQVNYILGTHCSEESTQKINSHLSQTSAEKSKNKR